MVLSIVKDLLLFAYKPQSIRYLISLSYENRINVIIKRDY